MKKNEDWLRNEAVVAYKENVRKVTKLFKDCFVKADPVAFVDSGKTFEQAKDFCFDEMRKTVRIGEYTIKEKIATKQAEITRLKHQLEIVKAQNAANAYPLSEAQKKCIQIGIEHEKNKYNGLGVGNKQVLRIVKSPR